uniref:Ig-like domain-containing protein n=1 Tax=Daphnia galeata TaxID=27404 RepID=A0A8J2WT58_9CRUS|nr:unnamed protein product [Daphnia galeata]
MAQLLASSITWMWIGTFCFTAIAPLIAAAGRVHSDGTSWGFEPEFTDSMNNVTVATGRDAVLSCSVANLGGHKVGWVKADTKAIQAIHLIVVTHNPRVSVEHIGSSQWKLIIKNVRKEDAGFYMAQIKPPDIIDERTPGELRVRENESLKLTCEARGNPAPRITWKREDGHDLHLSSRDEHKGTGGSFRNKSHGGPSVYSVDGETLRINQVSKRHMGVYYCIASNGVPPSVSKRVAVTVLFAPTVTVDNQIVGVPLGNNVTLGCIVESSPKSINVWYKDDKMIANSSRLGYEEKIESSYRVRMILTIGHFRKSDVGKYECRCRNELGEAEGTIKLHDLKPLITTTTTTPPPIFMMGENDIYPLIIGTTAWTRVLQWDRVLTTTGRPQHLDELPTQPIGDAEFLPSAGSASSNNHNRHGHEMMKATLRPRPGGHSSSSSATFTRFSIGHQFTVSVAAVVMMTAIVIGMVLS